MNVAWLKATLCIVLFLAGGLSFVVDVLNPNTPDPVVVERAAALALAFFLILKIWAECRSMGEDAKPHVLVESAQTVFDNTTTLTSNLFALHCSRLI